MAHTAEDILRALSQTQVAASTITLLVMGDRRSQLSTGETAELLVQALRFTLEQIEALHPHRAESIRQEMMRCWSTICMAEMADKPRPILSVVSA